MDIKKKDKSIITMLHVLWLQSANNEMQARSDTTVAEVKYSQDCESDYGLGYESGFLFSAVLARQDLETYICNFMLS